MLSNREHRSGKGFLIDPLSDFLKSVQETLFLDAGGIDEDFYRAAVADLLWRSP
jgi:hypothetical protein